MSLITGPKVLEVGFHLEVCLVVGLEKDIMMPPTRLVVLVGITIEALIASYIHTWISPDSLDPEQQCHLMLFAAPFK